MRQKEGRAGILESEIKLDSARGGNVEKKQEELAEVEQMAAEVQSAQMNTLTEANKELEAAATTLEAMASENYRSVTPAVFEVAMKVRYTDDVQTSSMYDLLREGISFDIGRLYASTFQNGTANLFRTTAKSGNPAGLLSNIKKNEKVIKKGINTIMEFFNK